MERLDWYGCYDGGWQSAPLVAEAYSHPAKCSFGLAERIYRHMLAEGWLRPGDQVLDPFGGIGGCAFHAALYGLHWTGVELEEKFVGLAQQNLDLWRARYAPHFPGYGSARILQGDSRRLVEIVAQADGVICVNCPNVVSLGQSKEASHVLQASARSDPAGDVRRSEDDASADSAGIEGQRTVSTSMDGGLQNRGTAVYREGQREIHARSDLRDIRLQEDDEAGAVRDLRELSESSGSSSGLRSLQQQPGEPASSVRIMPYEPAQTTVLGCDSCGKRTAEVKRPSWLVEGVISSPPYADAISNPATNTEYSGVGGAIHPRNYGQTPGQLGSLPAGSFDGVVSSPPYEASRVVDTKAQNGDISTIPEFIDSYGAGSTRRNQESRDTFWLAARIILEQTYTVLRPGAVAAWVTGDFVRAKQRVPFGAQWLALCESVGFVPLAWAVAWKTADHGAQLGMFAEDKPLRHDKVSFFRRLANASNPDAAILNEDVIFVRKEA